MVLTAFMCESLDDQISEMRDSGWHTMLNLGTAKLIRETVIFYMFMEDAIH